MEQQNHTKNGVVEWRSKTKDENKKKHYKCKKKY